MKLYTRIVKPRGWDEPIAIFMRTSAQRRYDERMGAWVRGCYQHTGQHGECTENFIRARKASKEETGELVRELRAIGYNPIIV